MAAVAYGLKDLYLGPVADDGGMGTELEKVNFSVIDTPVFGSAEGDKTNFEIEESDTPYLATEKPGEITFTASIYGLSAEVLARHFGGTYTPGATSADPGTWEAPAQKPTFERSLRAVHKQGGYLEIVRASVAANFEWKFQKNGLPQINLVATVLVPTKPGTAPYKFYEAEFVG